MRKPSDGAMTTIRVLVLGDTLLASKTLFVLGAVFALSFPSFAQTVGQVTGLVTDPSGSVIVGATVTITNSQTNIVHKTTTNSAGNYAFPALQPDVYNLKAEMPGFEGSVREGV